MCFSTARSLMYSVLAMPALLRPVAISLQHLAFSLGQPEQRRAGIGRLRGQQPLDDLRVQRGPAAGDLVQRADQLLDLGDPLLEQVPEPGDAVGEQVERVVRLDVLRQHHHAGARVLGADPLGGVDALVA